jgi:hypothetical protein
MASFTRLFPQGHLEDYARIMFAKAKELNVPAWILGEETEVARFLTA